MTYGYFFRRHDMTVKIESQRLVHVVLGDLPVSLAVKFLAGVIAFPDEFLVAIGGFA